MSAALGDDFITGSPAAPLPRWMFIPHLYHAYITVTIAISRHNAVGDGARLPINYGTTRQLCMNEWKRIIPVFKGGDYDKTYPCIMSPPSRLVCTSRVKRSSWCLGGSFLTSSGIFTRPTQFWNHWIWLHQYVKNELRVCSGRVIRVRCGLTRRKRRCRCRMHSEIRDVMQEADTHMHAHTYDENGTCRMAEGCVCIYMCAGKTNDRYI